MIKKTFFLSPSILSADFRYLEDQIHQTEEAGADWIHIDVMDGHFVPNLTMGPFIVEACRKCTSLPLDVHLMIDDPDLFLSPFVNAGADILSIHIENGIESSSTLKKIRSRNVKAGIVVNPATPLTAITGIINEIDLLLIMSVNPGYSGQAYIEKTAEKINHAVSLRRSTRTNFLIEVDGGINRDNLLSVLEAGADVIVAASAIYNTQASISSNIAALRR